MTSVSAGSSAERARRPAVDGRVGLLAPARRRRRTPGCRGAASAPTACSSTARTDCSAEVEATADRPAGSSAAVMIRATPGPGRHRAGGDQLGEDRRSCVRCHGATASARAAVVRGQAGRARRSRGRRTGWPSAPCRRRSAASRRTRPRPTGPAAPNSREHRVEGRQVAVALGVGEHAVAVEDQRRHQARPALPNSRMCSPRHLDDGRPLVRRTATAGPTCLLLGASCRNSRPDFMKRLLERGGDVDLGAAAGDQVLELLVDSPVPPCRAIGTPVASTRSRDPLGVQHGRRVYWPCALPMAGAKQSTPVRRMKSTATSRRLLLATPRRSRCRPRRPGCPRSRPRRGHRGRGPRPPPRWSGAGSPRRRARARRTAPSSSRRRGSRR